MINLPLFHILFQDIHGRSKWKERIILGIDIHVELEMTRLDQTKDIHLILSTTTLKDEFWRHSFEVIVVSVYFRLFYFTAYHNRRHQRPFFRSAHRYVAYTRNSRRFRPYANHANRGRYGNRFERNTRLQKSNLDHDLDMYFSKTSSYRKRMLDNEIDGYMSSTKQRLDRSIDDYMASKKEKLE